MTIESYGSEGQEFFSYLRKNRMNLQPVSAEKIFSPAENCAILAVDVTNGFCRAGALASPRVNTIVSPIVHLMKSAWKAGVRQFILSQDTHEPEAEEFSTWPAHCIRGTIEAETVEEIKQLLFYDSMTVVHKNSLSSRAGTEFSAWQTSHSKVSTYILAGDCTDLCIYQLAMELRTDADAHQLKRRVIVPADCVETYDFPTAPALQAGARPHPGDILHEFFLYHLALNGIEVFSQVV